MPYTNATFKGKKKPVPRLVPVLENTSEPVLSTSVYSTNRGPQRSHSLDQGLSNGSDTDYTSAERSYSVDDGGSHSYEVNVGFWGDSHYGSSSLFPSPYQGLASRAQPPTTSIPIAQENLVSEPQAGSATHSIPDFNTPVPIQSRINLQESWSSYQSRPDFRRDAYIWKHRPGLRIQRKILFDSGCEGGNWVSAAVVRGLQAEPSMHRLPESKSFVAFNNQPTSANHEIKLSFQVEDGIYSDVYFLVSDDDPPFDMVLGMDDCLDFGILQEPSFNGPVAKPNFFGGLIPRKQTNAKKREQQERDEKQHLKEEEHERRRQQRDRDSQQRWKEGTDEPKSQHRTDREYKREREREREREKERRHR